MKRALAIALFMSACCSGRTSIPRSLIAMALHRNVWVENKNGTSCAGVVFATNLVVTAKHCEGPEMRVNGREALVLREGRDDVLLLAAETGFFTPLVLNTHPQPGDVVFAVGNQAEMRDFYSQGTVARISDGRISTTGVVAIPGVSGSALFDARGFLVGINVEIIGTLLPNGDKAVVCGRAVPSYEVGELFK